MYKKKNIRIRKLEEQPLELPEVNKIDLIEEKDAVDLNHIVDQDIKNEVEEIVSNYQPNRAKDIDIELNIVLKDEILVYQRACRLAVSEQDEIDKQIWKWLNDGIIQPSWSDFVSPVVLVKKKDGTTRMCIDYRKLNEKIIKTRYPLPIMENQIDWLQEAKY